MQDRKRISEKIWTGNKTGIWLALLAALSMHVVVLFLPLSKQLAVSESPDALIEVQLTTHSTPPDPQQTEMEAEPPLPEIRPVPKPEPIENVAEVKSEPEPPVSQPPVMASIPQTPDLNNKPETMDRLDRKVSINSILSRQFISEAPVSDIIFGKQLPQQSSELQKEFHYPVRQNMITMLAKPMQELPFAYTPGLVHFAYDPGVKGDLQRFWDVITPEFGWRTRYGTEVRCIWMLVIVGCGWK